MRRLAFPWEPELIGDPYLCDGGDGGGGGDGDGGGNNGGGGGGGGGNNEGGGGADEGGGQEGDTGSGGGLGGGVDAGGFGGVDAGGFGGGFGGGADSSGFGGSVGAGLGGFGGMDMEASQAAALDALGQMAAENPGLMADLSSLQDMPGVTHGFSALEQSDPSGHVGQGFADLVGGLPGQSAISVGLDIGTQGFAAPTAPEPAGPIDAPTQQGFVDPGPSPASAVAQGFSALQDPSPAAVVEQGFSSLIGPPATPSPSRDVQTAFEQAFSPATSFNVDPAIAGMTLAGLPAAMVGPAPAAFGPSPSSIVEQDFAEFGKEPAQSFMDLTLGAPTAIGRSAAFAPPGMAIDINQPGFMEPGPPVGLVGTPFGFNPAQSFLATFAPAPAPQSPFGRDPVNQDPRDTLAGRDLTAGVMSAHDLSPGMSTRDTTATTALGLPGPDVQEVEQTAPQAQVGPDLATALGIHDINIDPSLVEMTAPSLNPQLTFDPTPMTMQSPFEPTFMDRMAPFSPMTPMSPFEFAKGRASPIGPEPETKEARGRGGKDFFDQEPGQFDPDFDRSAPPSPPSPPPAPSPMIGFAPSPSPIGLPPGVIDPFGEDFRRRLAVAQAMGIV